MPTSSLFRFLDKSDDDHASTNIHYVNSLPVEYEYGDDETATSLTMDRVAIALVPQQQQQAPPPAQVFKEKVIIPPGAASATCSQVDATSTSVQSDVSIVLHVCMRCIV